MLSKVAADVFDPLSMSWLILNSSHSHFILRRRNGVYFLYMYIWVFPKIGVPQNGWLNMENPIKMDDLGVPLFSETPIY